MNRPKLPNRIQFFIFFFLGLVPFGFSLNFWKTKFFGLVSNSLNKNLTQTKTDQYVSNITMYKIFQDSTTSLVVRSVFDNIYFPKFKQYQKHFNFSSPYKTKLHHFIDLIKTKNPTLYTTHFDRHSFFSFLLWVPCLYLLSSSLYHATPHHCSMPPLFLLMNLYFFLSSSSTLWWVFSFVLKFKLFVWFGLIFGLFIC